jgi:hypothetical protein
MSYKFDFNSNSKFNQDTYLGRLKHFFMLSNPIQFFLSDSDILEKKALYNSYHEKMKIDPNFVLTKEEYDTLWDAKYLINSTFHPETGNKIPKPFRVYSFTLVNVPIIVGLVVLPVTKFNLFFFNTLNQCYNASLNYYMGSKGEDNTKQLTISFLFAVSTSVAAAFLLKRILGNTGTSLPKNIIQRIAPTCIAGFLNLFFMRSSYFTEGIPFSDKVGKPLGVSKTIGTKAMLEGAISRFILPMPLVLAIICISRLVKMGIRGIPLKFLEISLSTAFIGVGLPLSIALFNQNGKSLVSGIEAENQKILKELRYEDKYVYYNKGL